MAKEAAKAQPDAEGLAKAELAGTDASADATPAASADAGTVTAAQTASAYNPLTDWGVYAAVFCGGFVGTLLRYGLSLALPQEGAAGGVMYWGTFAANMLAAFVYAAVAAYLAAAPWMAARRKERTNRALGMGLCGGLSTMSTFALEGFAQLRAAQAASDMATQDAGAAYAVVASSDSGPAIPADAAFVIYVALTFVIGVLLAYAGSALGARLAAGHRRASAGDGAATASADGIAVEDEAGSSDSGIDGNASENEVE